jgi:glycosyltransferase involved in cell wall biosynthesis
MTEIMDNCECSEVAKKIRILLVVRWPVGGIRTFMRYVYRRFDPQIYQLTILGPTHPELDILEQDLVESDVDIYRVSAYPKVYEFSLAIAKLLRQRKYNIVHSHGFTSGIASVLPTAFFRIPHLLTSHDVLGAPQFVGINGFMKRLVMRIVFSQVDAIHSVSNDAQENLFEFFPALSKQKNKCIVIANGIESERFISAIPRNLRVEFGLEEDCFLIGFMGRFMSQKGFTYLVEAIEYIAQNGSLRRKPIVLAFGEGGFVREEKVALAKRGLDEYFRFSPFSANIAGILKGLDVVVMPSLWEACGLLAMESLVSGTPLIASNCIGLREVVKETPTSVVPVKDSRALAKEIVHFMEEEGRAPFSDYIQTAARRYDVNTTTKLLQELVQTIAK